MRLKLIHRGDFRKSELTLFNEAMKAHKGLKLGSDDCVLFISGNGKILKFVYGFTEQEVMRYSTKETTGNTTKILESTVYRIDGSGTWNPLMLRNYADAAGVSLIGLKRFEQHYRER